LSYDRHTSLRLPDKASLLHQGYGGHSAEANRAMPAGALAEAGSSIYD